MASAGLARFCCVSLLASTLACTVEQDVPQGAAGSAANAGDHALHLRRIPGAFAPAPAHAGASGSAPAAVGGSDARDPDSGVRDAAVRDASPDAHVNLPNQIDASILDAGATPDAGASLDAGLPDAGALHDAGELDAAQPAQDAGSAPDASTPEQDASVPVDAGPAQDASSAPDAQTPTEDAAVDAGPACSGPPGLFKDHNCEVLSDGIEPYQPQYPLWSDGALKQRYIYLPPGTRIDTSNPDRWSFPLGTRLYKTFSAGSLKVETRVMEKVASATGYTSWTAVSYAWSFDGRSVTAVPSGVSDALGTGLDIPTQAQCRSCHNMQGADAPIGFNALQLNHTGAGITLADLLQQQRLQNGAAGTPNITLQNSVIPGDATTRAALGYLHGNCGHCHGGPTPRAEQRLWAVVGMQEVSDAPVVDSTVCHCLERWTGRNSDSGEPYVLRVAPSHAALSGIIGRMSSRQSGEQMPPLGTKLVDSAGLAAVRAWINKLEGQSCDASPPVCAP